MALSARALFDLEESHAVFEAEGVDAYAAYQRSRETSRWSRSPSRW